MDEQSVHQAAAALILERNQRPPAAGEIRDPQDLVGDEERSALARLETAIDARIDAALVLADVQYVTQTKILAMGVALAIAFGVGSFLEATLVVSMMVGLAAVPLAPVAKDLATALQEAVKALKAR